MTYYDWIELVVHYLEGYPMTVTLFTVCDDATKNIIYNFTLVHSKNRKMGNVTKAL